MLDMCDIIEIRKIYNLCTIVDLEKHPLFEESSMKVELFGMTELYIDAPVTNELRKYGIESVEFKVPLIDGMEILLHRVECNDKAISLCHKDNMFYLGCIVSHSVLTKMDADVIDEEYLRDFLTSSMIVQTEIRIEDKDELYLELTNTKVVGNVLQKIAFIKSGTRKLLKLLCTRNVIRNLHTDSFDLVTSLAKSYLHTEKIEFYFYLKPDIKYISYIKCLVDNIKDINRVDLNFIFMIEETDIEMLKISVEEAGFHFKYNTQIISTL